ncbi:2,4-dihydroxyhept-2-ene-1,7-dioic acid aldolase [Candidatus Parcubacteria bacterium]|nr:2,4-dihydroxyhept-2-ene-1,7-dioic acid aldolase [Candidatus Parcubacteria bacterium]
MQMTPRRTLKRKLVNRELTVGSWLSLGHAGVTEMMASGGFEWLVIDSEHTSLDPSMVEHMIRTIELSGKAPLVRVSSNDPSEIKRVLDAGAAGILVPMVNSAEDARAAVDAAYYPPRGRRGAGLYRAQGYGLGFDRHRAESEESTVVIAQIEHADGVRNLESILAVDGVDGFIIGPYDLSGSVGKPGQLDSPEVRTELEKVARVVRAGNKVAGFHVVHSDRALLENKIREGYRFLVYGDDMVFLAEKIRDECGFIASIRQ